MKNSSYLQGRIDAGLGTKEPPPAVDITEWLQARHDANVYREWYYRTFRSQIQRELDSKEPILNRVWDRNYLNNLT